MDGRLAKTAAGREEIKNRARKLTRPARNLLLIIDATRVGSDWMQLVHGATEADLRQLLAEGLVEPTAAPVMARPAAWSSVAEALTELTYDQLYHLVTSQAKDRLGLIRGFKMVLD